MSNDKNATTKFESMVKDSKGNMIKVKLNHIRAIAELIKDNDEDIAITFKQYAKKYDTTSEAIEELAKAYIEAYPANSSDGITNKMRELRSEHRLEALILAGHINAASDTDDETWSKLQESNPEAILNYCKSLSQTIRNLQRMNDVSRYGLETMLVSQKFEMDESTGLINTDKPVNPQNHFTVCQCGWDDGSKVLRDQHSDGRDSNIVGTITPIRIFNNILTAPTDLNDQYSDGRPVYLANAKKNVGYWVQFPYVTGKIEDFADGVPFGKLEETPKPKRSPRNSK